MKLLLAFLVSLPTLIYSQTISPTQYFDSTYDITNENMIPGYDSSLILSGAIHSFPPALYIHKVDLDGNLISEKSIEAYTADMLFPSKLIPTMDSNYITVNTIIQSSFNKLVFNKWDQNLDTVWQKIYGFNADMKIGSIIESFDSSLYVSFGDDQDLYVAKLNYFGELLWTKQYNYTSNVSPSSLVEMLDSNICLMSRNYDGTYLTVTDSSGAEILTKEITDHSCYELIQSITGNIYLLGTSTSSNNVALIKLNSNLNITDSKSIPYLFTLENSQLKFVSDTTLIAGSSTYGQYGSAFSIIDTLLNEQVTTEAIGEFRTFCSKYDEIYFSEQGPLLGVKAQIITRHYTVNSFFDDTVACHYNNSVTLSTWASSISSSSTNVLTTNGQIIDIQLPIGNPNFGSDHSCISFFGSLNEENQSQITLYPNPTKGQFKIESKEGQTIEEVMIHTTDGRLVYSDENINSIKTKVNLDHLPSGIYYVKVKIEDVFVYEKIIKD